MNDPWKKREVTWTDRVFGQFDKINLGVWVIRTVFIVALVGVAVWGHHLWIAFLDRNEDNAASQTNVTNQLPYQEFLIDGQFVQMFTPPDNDHMVCLLRVRDVECFPKKDYQWGFDE